MKSDHPLIFDGDSERDDEFKHRTKFSSLESALATAAISYLRHRSSTSVRAVARYSSLIEMTVKHIGAYYGGPIAAATRDPGREVPKAMKYIEKNGIPIVEPDLLKWGRWFNKADRHVGRWEKGKVKVSTIFLGIDHNFTGGAQPILYETMVFGGANDEYTERYCTREEALKRHGEIVAAVQAGEALP